MLAVSGYVPLLAAILGLALYFWAKNSKVSTAGLVAYAAGLLVTLAGLAGKVWRL